MHKPTDSRSQVNPKRESSKKFTPRYKIAKLLKTKDKEIILKATKE